MRSAVQKDALLNTPIHRPGLEMGNPEERGGREEEQERKRQEVKLGITNSPFLKITGVSSSPAIQPIATVVAILYANPPTTGQR